MITPTGTPNHSIPVSPADSRPVSGRTSPTHAEVAGHFEMLLNIPRISLGSTRRPSVDTSLPTKQLAQAEKHVERITAVLSKLQEAVLRSRAEGFKSSLSDTHLSAVAGKLTHLRNLWANGELAGTRRWLRIGNPVAHWTRASGERFIAQALASLEEGTKVDAGQFTKHSDQALDFHLQLGSLHKMKL